MSKKHEHVTYKYSNNNYIPRTLNQNAMHLVHIYQIHVY